MSPSFVPRASARVLAEQHFDGGRGAGHGGCALGGHAAGDEFRVLGEAVLELELRARLGVVIGQRAAGRRDEEAGGGAHAHGLAGDVAAIGAQELVDGIAAGVVVGGERLGVRAVDEEVEREGPLGIEGVAEAEVTDGIGVEEDAGHEGRSHDDAADEGGEHAPMPEAAPGDHANDGGEATQAGGPS